MVGGASLKDINKKIKKANESISPYQKEYDNADGSYEEWLNTSSVDKRELIIQKENDKKKLESDLEKLERERNEQLNERKGLMIKIRSIHAFAFANTDTTIYYILILLVIIFFDLIAILLKEMKVKGGLYYQQLESDVKSFRPEIKIYSSNITKNPSTGLTPKENKNIDTEKIDFNDTTWYSKSEQAEYYFDENKDFLRKNILFGMWSLNSNELKINTGKISFVFTIISKNKISFEKENRIIELIKL